MNEPLNTLLTSINFFAKSCNIDSLYENQPLRLTSEQTSNQQTRTPDIFHPSKPPRLIEKATSQPIEVINEVFDQVTLGDLTDDLLPNWLRVAVINIQSPYSDGNGREILYEFYEQLIAFVTQLHLASENQQLTNLSSHVTDFFFNVLLTTSNANWPIFWKPVLAMIADILTAFRPGKPGWCIIHPLPGGGRLSVIYRPADEVRIKHTTSAT